MLLGGGEKKKKPINLLICVLTQNPESQGVQGCACWQGGVVPLPFSTALSPPSSTLVTPLVPFLRPRRKLGFLFHKENCHHTLLKPVSGNIYVYTYTSSFLPDSEGAPPIPGPPQTLSLPPVFLLHLFLPLDLKIVCSFLSASKYSFSFSKSKVSSLKRVFSKKICLPCYNLDPTSTTTCP